MQLASVLGSSDLLQAACSECNNLEYLLYFVIFKSSLLWVICFCIDCCYPTLTLALVPVFPLLNLYLLFEPIYKFLAMECHD